METMNQDAARMADLLVARRFVEAEADFIRSAATLKRWESAALADKVLGLLGDNADAIVAEWTMSRADRHVGSAT